MKNFGFEENWMLIAPACALFSAKKKTFISSRDPSSLSVLIKSGEVSRSLFMYVLSSTAFQSKDINFKYLYEAVHYLTKACFRNLCEFRTTLVKA